MKRLDPLSKFSIKKIGTGRLFRAGSLNSRRKVGLAGALRKYKQEGRHSYAKNLSRKDIKYLHEDISEVMSKLSPHSKGPGIRARRRLEHKWEVRRREGKWSRADVADAKKFLTTTMNSGNSGAKEMAPTKPRRRAVAFGSDRIAGGNGHDEGHMTPEAQKHIKANIQLDNMREIAAEDRGETKMDYAPNSVLGKQQAQQTTASKNTKKGSHGKKVELPDTTNLPDMDIG